MLDLVIACATLGVWVFGLWICPRCVQLCKEESSDHETEEVASVVIEETTAMYSAENAQDAEVDKVILEEATMEYLEKVPLLLPRARLIAINGHPVGFKELP